MLKDFKDFVAEKGLLKKADKTLITVSGGRDSIVLCDLFYKAGYSFAIAHCNFQLRGKEADQDEEFVKKTAQKYKVQFFVKRFETDKLAKENKLSIQEAARVLRYQWFEEIREENGFDFIATAHHKDDSIETFFINLVRGTGIAGLTGIEAKRGNIIRPLLFADRKEIDDFVKKNKLKFREDSSNASDKYLRNKIRHNIVPLFDEINPSFKKTLSEEIERLKDVKAVFNHFVESAEKEVLKNNVISIPALKKILFPSVLLYEILKKYNFNGDVAADVFSSIDSEPGKVFYSPTHRLVKDRQSFIIAEKKDEKYSDLFQVAASNKKLNQPIKLEFSKLQNKKGLKIPADNNIVFLDYDKLQFPLELRKWKRGDFFYPLGMNKKKKLSDFFTDIKLSIPEKENTWLLCSGGKIVYVLGKRIDEHYKVAKDTKLIYIVRCI